MPTKTEAQTNAAHPKRQGATRVNLERRRVADVQRSRLLAAIAEVCAEQGAPNVTVAHVVSRSGVSRRTFYDLFEDRDDCFLAAFDDAIARAAEYVLPAYRARGAWRKRMRASLEAALQYFDDEPFRGRLLVAETLAAGPLVLLRRQQVLNRVIEAVDEGRSEARAGAELSPLTAEGVVGAVLSVIHARMLESHPQSLAALANELMAIVVLPYAGAAAARRELSCSTSKKPAPRPSASQDVLSELGMRMTYRTICVLTAVGAQPGLSNRRIADAAGISDPGQISKLLGRLFQLGLIVKASDCGHARGEPNAWRLTDKGEQVQRTIASKLSC